MTLKGMWSLLLTAAVGDSGKETFWAGMTAAGGYVAANFLGGWDMALRILLFVMVSDYIVGVLSAVKHKAVSSEVMFWGGVRKAVVLLVISIAAMCDQWIGEGPMFRTLALFFYIGREGLSIMENLNRLGVPLPPVLMKFLIDLQKKGKGE